MSQQGGAEMVGERWAGGGRGHWAMTGVEEAGGGKELRDM